MTKPRSSLIDLATTPYYHCISRCVRRAYLFGSDEKGRSFDHRKTWLVARLKKLAEIFAIDIAAYAVMSNHYHLVLHVDCERAQTWSEEEVRARWSTLYKGPTVLQRSIAGESLLPEERALLTLYTVRWRAELCNISRFMATLNYVIALQANKEDGCTGRFWEGRFKSQALKDEAALLACMAYVDLNPVRAGMATTLQESDFTSIQDRLRRIGKKRVASTRPSLMALGKPEKGQTSVPIELKDYVELVEWYGRHTDPRKRGYIEKGTPAILQHLGLSDTHWKALSQEVNKEASTMLDGLETLALLERRANRQKVA